MRGLKPASPCLASETDAPPRALTARPLTDGLAGVSAIRPAPAMDDGVERLAAAARGGPRGSGVRGPVAERDDAHRVELGGDAERLADGSLTVARDPEEAATEAGVDCGQQDEQRRHRGVHVPERHRPA